MKLIFLSAISLLVRPIFSFCVYNNLEHGGHLHVLQDMPGDDDSKNFLADLNPGEKQCCHYSNRDCSPAGKDNDLATFTATINFESGSQGRWYFLSCTTGGALELSGNFGNIVSTCTKADGSVTRNEIPFKTITSSNQEPNY